MAAAPSIAESAAPPAQADADQYQDHEHAHALEVSPWARSSSRLLLIVGGVTYTAWHWVHRALQASAVDPLGERIAFLGLIVALVGLSYHPALKRHLVSMGYLVVALGTVHYFSLVARNNVSSAYTIGVFVVIGGVSSLLVSARATVTYAALTVALAVATTGLCTAAALEDRLELLVGTMTIQIGLCVSAWRNSILKGAVRELVAARVEIRQLRGLLPICMHCNRIREKGGHWKQFEAYVEAHTEAAFTHALCVECADKYYPGA